MTKDLRKCEEQSEIRIQEEIEERNKIVTQMEEEKVC